MTILKNAWYEIGYNLVLFVYLFDFIIFYIYDTMTTSCENSLDNLKGVYLLEVHKANS